MISLGIDIGGGSIKSVLLDGDAEQWAGTSRRYARPSADDFAACLRALLDSAPIDRISPDRVGLCVPGVYDQAAGALAASINLPGLVGVPLATLLRTSWPDSAPPPSLDRVESDAFAAAFDFAADQVPTGRCLALSLGTGVGAVVLDDLAPLQVTGLSSGHLGQIDVSGPGIDPVPIGPDGGRGGLEGYLGLPALIARHGEPSRWLKELKGNEPELAALARALRIAHAIYRPNVIALLGGVGIRLQPVLATLDQMVRSELTSLARPGWRLACGTSDLHAARGVARLASR